MKKILRKITPEPIWNIIKMAYFKFVGRFYNPGETTKAKKRRIKEGFFSSYCKGKGLDIGYGGDLLSKNCKGWDFEDGDAQYLKGLKNLTFDFVYSSHTLEHLRNPRVSIKNWWRVLKPGGYLILYLPHRDLYEKKKTLPSRWNQDHKHFFLLYEDDPPDTISIIHLIKKTLSNYKIVYAKECREGHTIKDPKTHSDGEYSIEVIVQKKECYQ